MKLFKKYVSNVAVKTVFLFKMLQAKCDISAIVTLNITREDIFFCNSHTQAVSPVKLYLLKAKTIKIHLGK